MLPASYGEILRAEGFQQIAELQYRLRVAAWWNAARDRRMQALIIPIGTRAIVKADKTYYVTSISRAGETWARDVRALHDYLENHLPELRLSFSHFRDVPSELAEAEVRRRDALNAPTRSTPTLERIAELQRDLRGKREAARTADTFLSLSHSPPDLLTGFARQQARTQQDAVAELEAQVQREQQRFAIHRHLQREYQRKGSAAVYAFTASSHLQIATSAREFREALRAVVRELVDQHRYEITQRLQGGRLNIHVEESDEPAMTWIEQWLGGALCPTQLERLDARFEPVRQAAQRHVIVTPDEPITIDDRTRHGEKHLAAHVLATIADRLDKDDDSRRGHPLDPSALSTTDMPLHVGLRETEDGKAGGPACLPFTQFVHAALSGTTGSGKSFAARVVVEEACQYRDLSILVVDPRNQAIGLRVPEDRHEILDRYAAFDLKRDAARGFPFAYYAPALDPSRRLPDNLAELSRARSIVSCKGMNDAERCMTAAHILNTVFDALTGSECARPRLLIVCEEAQLLTRKRVQKPARDAAGEAERALERIAREGRKYGITLILVTQAMKDFGHELASLRQMINTRFFFRNSDNELTIAEDVIGDGRTLLQLATGTAVVHNASWGAARIRFRPPYSRVLEPDASELHRVLHGTNVIANSVSAAARGLYARIAATGQGHIHLSGAAELAGITSRRKLYELVRELERAGMIRTRHLAERGQPRVIELVSDVPE